MVYTNLTSEVHVKSLINCPSGSYIDSNSITDDINIVTNTISFRETGFNKTIKNDRVFGDTVITTIQRPTQTELNIILIMDEDNIEAGKNIQDVLSNMSDLKTVDNYQVYNEDDNKRRHRIAMMWNDNTNTYMKVYYNAYVENINLSKDDSLEVTMKLVVPIMDIQTGSSNYYEYEGTGASTVLSNLDSAMQWS